MPHIIKAFDISKNIPLTWQGELQSNDAFISCKIGKNWYSHESDGLNPDWFSLLNKLFLWRNSKNELKTNLSKTLPNLGTSEPFL